MKILIVYDSYFGNTEKVARVMQKALHPDASAVKAGKVKPADLRNVDLLLVGGPTRAFRATKPILDFIKSIPDKHIRGVKAAAFDTRIALEDAPAWILRLGIRLFGYADTKIEKALKKRGAKITVRSTGFNVKDAKGPLKDGELKRVEKWAKKAAS